MWIVPYASCIAMIANVVLCIVQVRRTRQLARKLEQVALLECLLRTICVEAFLLRHRAIWRAYAQSMGTIEVSVSSRPKVRSPE